MNEKPYIGQNLQNEIMKELSKKQKQRKFFIGTHNINEIIENLNFQDLRNEIITHFNQEQRRAIKNHKSDEYNTHLINEPLNLPQIFNQIYLYLDGETSPINIYQIKQQNKPSEIQKILFKTESDFENFKKRQIKKRIELRIKFYEKHLESKYTFLNDNTDELQIILKGDENKKGIDFGYFSEIKENLYYCFDGFDYITNLNNRDFLVPLDFILDMNSALYKENKNIFENLLNKDTATKKNSKNKDCNKKDKKIIYNKIDTSILKQYNKYNKIPLTDYKANLALLYALMHERNNKGYRYRKFVLLFIQNYITCSYLIRSAKDETIKETIKNRKNRDIFTNSHIQKRILYYFFPDRKIFYTKNNQP